MIRNIRRGIRLIEHALDTRVEASKTMLRGFNTNFEWRDQPKIANDSPNVLRTFFNNRKKGAGIWKWDHYFDIYDRHFARFRGHESHLLEIGVYSGGSLEMWRDYLGPKAHIYGVDIESACRLYEDEQTRIFIGDQADRKFWRDFRRKIPTLDIVVDDGGHEPEQQIVSLEELLPHLRPGGVYCCEDVVGTLNRFACYVHGIAHKLNDAPMQNNTEEPERRLVCPASSFQTCVASIHLYPFVAVIERSSSLLTEFVAPKHGTQWQPFLK